MSKKSFNLTSLNECLESGSAFCKVDVDENDNHNNNNNGGNSIDLQLIYKSFVDYFGNLMMTKNKLIGNTYCAYVAKIRTGLAFGSRIVVVVIPDDGMPLGAMRPLNTLHWLNFQTRFAKQEMNMVGFVMPETKDSIMNLVIERTFRDSTKTEYKVVGCSDLKITLFKKKDSIQDWTDRNRLYVALNTFCCSVDLI